MKLFILDARHCAAFATWIAMLKVYGKTLDSYLPWCWHSGNFCLVLAQRGKINWGKSWTKIQEILLKKIKIFFSLLAFFKHFFLVEIFQKWENIPLCASFVWFAKKKKSSCHRFAWFFFFQEDLRFENLHSTTIGLDYQQIGNVISAACCKEKKTKLANCKSTKENMQVMANWFLYLLCKFQYVLLEMQTRPLNKFNHWAETEDWK